MTLQSRLLSPSLVIDESTSSLGDSGGHFILTVFCIETHWGTPCILGVGKNGHLFSESWRALAIIFKELGSKL